MRKFFTAVLLFFAVSVSQAVTLDFEDLAVGTSPGDSYAQYGVHFHGGTVHANQYGNYLVTPTLVTFDAPIHGISFYADGLHMDAMGSLCYGSGMCETFWLGQMSFNPTTSTRKNLGWYEGQAWRYELPWDDIVSVGFNTYVLDRLSFNVPVVAVAAAVDGSVPAPPTLLLLLLGGVFLLGRHRQGNFKVINQRA